MKLLKITGDNEFLGFKVDIYLNLHNRLWSVKNRKTGRVIFHSDRVAVSDVTFIVQKSGRNRVLKEKQKNVHAFVRGTLCSVPDYITGSEITYNPYKFSSFVTMNDFSPVVSADIVVLNDSVLAQGLNYGL